MWKEELYCEVNSALPAEPRSVPVAFLLTALSSLPDHWLSSGWWRLLKSRMLGYEVLHSPKVLGGSGNVYKEMGEEVRGINM
jgi:hypothetical protein